MFDSKPLNIFFCLEVWFSGSKGTLILSSFILFDHTNRQKGRMSHTLWLYMCIYLPQRSAKERWGWRLQRGGMPDTRPQQACSTGHSLWWTRMSYGKEVDRKKVRTISFQITIHHPHYSWFNEQNYLLPYQRIFFLYKLRSPLSLYVSSFLSSLPSAPECACNNSGQNPTGV